MKSVCPTLSLRHWCGADHRTRCDDLTRRPQAFPQTSSEPNERWHGSAQSRGCQTTISEGSITQELACALRQGHRLFRIDRSARPDGKPCVESRVGDGLCGANAPSLAVTFDHLEARGRPLDGSGNLREFGSG